MHALTRSLQQDEGTEFPLKTGCAVLGGLCNEIWMKWGRQPRCHGEDDYLKQRESEAEAPTQVQLRMFKISKEASGTGAERSVGQNYTRCRDVSSWWPAPDHRAWWATGSHCLTVCVMQSSAGLWTGNPHHLVTSKRITLVAVWKPDCRCWERIKARMWVRRRPREHRWNTDWLALGEEYPFQWESPGL